MHVLALLQKPADVERVIPTLAEALGLAAAEGRMRMAPEPPALLARLPETTAQATAAQLARIGLKVLALEERIPERFPVRSFSLTPEGLEVSARSGASRSLPWRELTVVLRGASSERATLERTEKTKSFDLGRALITSGLSMTKTKERTVQKTEHALEHVVLVRHISGEVLAFRESELEFTSLGAAMQPSKMGNMIALTRILRERAPHAWFDDRLVRLGTRQLPFIVGAETHLASEDTRVTRVQTAGALDLLSELLFVGREAGLV